MSRKEHVITLVRQRGKATVKDLLPHCPGCTHDQVARALFHAAATGLLQVVGKERVGRSRGASHLSIFAAPGAPLVPDAPTKRASQASAPPPRGQWTLGRVASVFDMGASA